MDGFDPSKVVGSRIPKEYDAWFTEATDMLAGDPRRTQKLWDKFKETYTIWHNLCGDVDAQWFRKFKSRLDRERRKRRYVNVVKDEYSRGKRLMKPMDDTTVEASAAASLDTLLEASTSSGFRQTFSPKRKNSKHQAACDTTPPLEVEAIIMMVREAFKAQERYQTLQQSNSQLVEEISKMRNDLAYHKRLVARLTSKLEQHSTKQQEQPTDVICTFIDVSLRAGDKHLKRRIQRSDLRCLQPKAWLNDTVVSYYISRYIPRYDGVYNFDCQLYAPILSHERCVGTSYDKYLKLCGLTEPFEWEKYRYIQIPCAQDGHWSLLVLENPFELAQVSSKELYAAQTSIYHVDSISGYHNTQEIANRVMRYVGYEMYKKTGKAHSKKFRLVSVATDPQQENGSDCALYVIHYMTEINRIVHETPAIVLREKIRAICKSLDSEKCNKLRQSMRNLFMTGSE